MFILIINHSFHLLDPYEMFNANRASAQTTSGLIWSLLVSSVKREVVGATVPDEFELSLASGIDRLLFPDSGFMCPYFIFFASHN
jgi:hypothetical protein